MPEIRNNLPLTEGSIPRGLITLATPMLISALLQNIQSLIDLFWVGSLGADAVAAVAMAGTILMLLFPMLMGLSTGTVALVARAMGAGQPQEASRAAEQSILLAITLGGLSGVVGWVLSDHLFNLLGASPEVLAAGSDYLKISLLGSFTVFILFLGSAALQGAGDAKTPMAIMAVANVLNIILDPVFIYGWGPWQGMGVQGAAVATVLAQLVAALMMMVVLDKGRSGLTLKPSYWRADWKLMWRILRIGIPGSGQMLSRSLMSAVMMRVVAACGTTAVAAYGIGLRFHMIILMPAFALGGAAATLVGQNLGAGKPDRARQSAWLATAMDLAVMVVAAVLLMLFAPALIRIFNQDPDVVTIGADYLRTVSPFYVFAAFGVILGRALNGAGDSFYPMVFTIISLWGLQVPLAVLLARFWMSPIQGIWWAIVAGMVLNGIMILAWFESGRWKRQRI